MSSSSIAVLVAAGRGERMGAGRAKAFLPLAGRPLLLRAAEAFEAAPEVEAIVAVVPADEQRTAHDLLAPLRKVLAVVAGGATRQDSVRAGLEALPAAFDGIVLVHDAACERSSHPHCLRRAGRGRGGAPSTCCPRRHHQAGA